MKNTYIRREKNRTLWKEQIRLLGVAQGKAECILEILSDYGQVPPGIQEQILTQTSFPQLRRWFLLARQVRSVDEFLYRM